MLAAETGKGKTMLCIGIAFAMHLGRDFLHWKAGRPARVLYIDGEMPRDLMQGRIRLAARWFDLEEMPGDGLFFMSREDFADMPPMDSPEWREWIDAYLDALKPDFAIADNLMSLTVGNMKETDSWRIVEPWIMSLAGRRIGCLLVHHLGHDKTKSYGDSTKEWMLDYVILGQGIDDPEASISLALEFKKARRRRPETMADFANVAVALKGDAWTSTAEPKRQAREPGAVKLNEQGKLFVEATRTAIKYVGDKPPHHDETRDVTRAVTLDQVRTYWRQRLSGTADDGEKDVKKEAARERQNWHRGHDGWRSHSRADRWTTRRRASGGRGAGLGSLADPAARTRGRHPLCTRFQARTRQGPRLPNIYAKWCSFSSAFLKRPALGFRSAHARALIGRPQAVGVGRRACRGGPSVASGSSGRRGRSARPRPDRAASRKTFPFTVPLGRFPHRGGQGSPLW